jgi:hypothetical protein
LIQAQTPDLSGRWILRKENSIIPQGGGGGGGRGRMMPGGGGGGITIQMTITHEENSLTIAKVDEGPRGDRTRTTETFTTDGKPDTIETDTGNVIIKAEWKRNSLIVERSRTMMMRDREMTMTTIETFTLDPEGTWLMVFIEQAVRAGGAPGTPTTLMFEKRR